jgi:ATP-dependent Lhr-like helicase
VRLSAGTLGTQVGPRPADTCIRLREDVTPAEWRKAIAETADQLCLPVVDARALNGLEFSAALPTRLAEATLAARLADLDGAMAALRGPTRFAVRGQ